MDRGPIHRSSIAAAAIGAVLSPLPLVDELVLLPIYGRLARKIGKSHGLRTLQMPWWAIGRTTLAGLTARAAVNLTVGFIPGVAAVANAASAFALTQFLGEYYTEACAHPKAARPIGVRAIVDRIQRFRSTPAPAAPSTT